MTDPYRIVADAYCPHCGVKGRLLAEFETRYEGGDYEQDSTSVEVRTCVDCGAFHDAPDIGLDGWLKERRIHFARLIEGRPYEPPAPVPREPSRINMDAYDTLLRHYYGPERVASYAMQVTFGEPVRAKPIAWNDVTIESDAPNPWPFLIGSLPDLPGPEDE